MSQLVRLGSSYCFPTAAQSNHIRFELSENSSHHLKLSLTPYINRSHKVKVNPLTRYRVNSQNRHESFRRPFFLLNSVLTPLCRCVRSYFCSRVQLLDIAPEYSTSSMRVLYSVRVRLLCLGQPWYTGVLTYAF